MRRFSVIFFVFLFIGNAFAYKLSDQARISILTCSPGEELYTAFGHSAIWIDDPVHNVNWVFHYGTFDFNQPNFYFNFVKGRLNYMLAVQSYRSFINEYGADRRAVHVLELNLPHDKKEEIFNYLMWKRLPENKYYLYDFFYDNCATRVRDVFIRYLGDSLILPQKQLDVTYRDVVFDRVKDRPWTSFGINLVLGLPADKKLDYYSAMFLPDYVDTVFSQARIDVGGCAAPLVQKEYWLLNFNRKELKYPFYGPLYVFALLALIVLWLSYKQYQGKNISLRWLDFVLFFVVGLAGVVIFVLWFFTDHSPAKNNLNILWAVPFHIVYAFKVVKKEHTDITAKYARFFFFYYLAFLIIGPFLPQAFDMAVWPLIITLMVRLFVLGKFKAIK